MQTLNDNSLLQQHFASPHNVGSLDSNSPNVRVGKVGLPGGDVLELYVLIEEEKMVDAKFRAQGNPYLIAMMSYLTDFLINKSLKELEGFNYQVLINVFAIPKVKTYCALLVEDVLKDTLYD